MWVDRRWFSLQVVFIIFVGWWLYEASQRWHEDLETLQNDNATSEKQLVLGYWLLNVVLIGLATWAAVSIWRSPFFRF